MNGEHVAQRLFKYNTLMPCSGVSSCKRMHAWSVPFFISLTIRTEM